MVRLTTSPFATCFCSQGNIDIKALALDASCYNYPQELFGLTLMMQGPIVLYPCRYVCCEEEHYAMFTSTACLNTSQILGTAAKQVGLNSWTAPGAFTRDGSKLIWTLLGPAKARQAPLEEEEG